MLIQTEDFNKSDRLLNTGYAAQWQNIEHVLNEMPLHLKASDQAGLQGTAIFDPVGTNAYIKAALLQLEGWHSNVVIPDKYKFLGTDVDFINDAVLVEAQFSNYPFLLNNLLRSELFFQAKTALHVEPVKAVVIITKAHMFPASNSTLYYEQAQNQLSALAEENVYDVPIRLVGLFESTGNIDAIWTEYADSRYSRTVVTQETRTFRIQTPRTGRGRATITAV